MLFFAQRYLKLDHIIERNLLLPPDLKGIYSVIMNEFTEYINESRFVVPKFSSCLSVD